VTQHAALRVEQRQTDRHAGDHLAELGAGFEQVLVADGPQQRLGRGVADRLCEGYLAIAKGGRQAIRGVLEPAQRPGAPGLYLMDTPFFSPESMTAMIAAGAQIVIFTTGAGNSYCSLVAPTFKMSANRATTERLGAQIDFAAPGVMDRSMTLDAAARDAMDRLLAVASGALTFGEIVGEGTEVVSRLGASV